MENNEPAEIQALRDAIAFSPENVPLRKHLADTLMKYGRFEAAEVEYKEALLTDAGNVPVKVALASAYYQQEKRSEAFVILEELETAGGLSPEGQLLYVKLLCQTTELVKAAQVYKALLAVHPEMEDEAIQAELEAFLVEEPHPGDSDFDTRLPIGDMPGDVMADIERPKITFEEVGGMNAVKEEIRMKIIHPIQHADLFAAYGKKAGGGILLYGPPGCGKTLLARATAGEVKSSFLSVGLHDVLDMWIGQSEKNLHELFKQARRSNPAVLFFDEVDALGANRTDLKHSASRNTINQFLSELDGVDASNDGLLVLAATNAPWHLDSALRRPGRFDRIIFVPPPDLEARESILRLLLKDKPADSIDYAAVAKKADGFSGADLKAVVDMAVEAKLEEAMKKGGLAPISTKDLIRSVKKVKPSTKDWFATAKNYALYSNQSGLYDEILDYMKIKR